MLIQCMICKKYKWGENDWRKESPNPKNKNISHTSCGSDFCNAEWGRIFFEEE